MPYPSPPRALTGPRRRSLLASATGAALLTGCSGPGGTGGPSRADRVRARAARDSQDLVERYDAVAAAHPALAERLRPLRAETAAHRDAFGGAGTQPAGTPGPPRVPAGATAAAASSGPSASASATGTGSAPAGTAAADAVPADGKDALAGLAAAEWTVANRRSAALLEVPGELARLLASVAAAGAAHAFLLTGGGA
ncbi:hypothetical protein [Streptomyces tropicalis]|uniref:Lipoprotein n=1 Tax=Streptomyces tropicalis TaxID=3034234 RepID=A0ABT6AE80_9ACTN|nr:hypothetical protein [Streptomyces tropicalis]MDF3302646.1 hypothetical protein [Streptomyces tropicalis]